MSGALTACAVCHAGQDELDVIARVGAAGPAGLAEPVPVDQLGVAHRARGQRAAHHRLQFRTRLARST